MAFTDLSQTSQDLIMVNFELFGKLLILGIALFWSVYYLMYVHKQNTTPYLMISLLKMFAYVSSVMYIFLLPLFIFVLYPVVKLETMLLLFIWAYVIIIILLGIFFTIGLFYYTPFIMLRAAGIDVSLPGDQQAISKLEKTLGFKGSRRGRI